MSEKKLVMRTIILETKLLWPPRYENGFIVQVAECRGTRYFSDGTQEEFRETYYCSGSTSNHIRITI